MTDATDMNNWGLRHGHIPCRSARNGRVHTSCSCGWNSRWRIEELAAREWQTHLAVAREGGRQRQTVKR